MTLLFRSVNPSDVLARGTAPRRPPGCPMPALARDANPCTSALSERGHIGCRPAHMLERWMLFAALSSGLSLGCYVVTPSQGGGEVDDLDELIAYISALRAHGG